MKSLIDRLRATEFLLGIVVITGVIMFSQGLSFARWVGPNFSEFSTNLHAALLTAGGIALLIVSILLRRTIKEARRMESRLAKLEGQSKLTLP